MIQAKCPTCQQLVTAKTIKQLAKLVASHCQRPRTFREPTRRVWEFARDVQSANQTVYAHWSAYNRDKSSWRTAMQDSAGSMGGCYTWSQWVITRIYCGRSQEMDYGNLVGGYKPVPDWLQEWGVILDDNPRRFKCEYQQVRSAQGVTRTTLELLDFKP